MPERILIVEDEPDLANLLEVAFKKQGWTPVVARNGREALERLTPPPQLVVLDLNLPELSGLEVCRRLRREPGLEDVPVVITSARADEIDRVVGFEVGADDYVTKPFSVRELILRIQALLRRSRLVPEPLVAGRQVFGRLTVEPDAHRAWVDGAEVELTPIEYRMLLTFLGRRGRASSREELLARTWGEDHHVTVRTVDTHVKRLRAKLGLAGDYLQTLRGVGYRWASSPDEAA